MTTTNSASSAPRRLLTAEQSAAMRTDVSIGLSAGAGCGKTFVLTRRFLSHLEPGPDTCELSQLVAITFTERAAREMRDRIRQECRRRLMNCPETEAEHWQRLLRQLDGARVSTIHAFCASLLRANAVETGIDPKFTLLDEIAAAAFLRNAVEHALHDQLIAQNPDAALLVYEFGLERARWIVERLVGERYRLDFARWRDRSAESMAENWERQWHTQAVPRLLGDLAGSPLAMRILQVLTEHEPSGAVMQNRRRVLLAELPRLPQAPDSRAALERLREHAQIKGSGGRHLWDDPETGELLRDLFGRLRKRIDKLLANWEWDRNQTRTAAEVGLAALRLVEGVGSQYDLRKREQAALDFDDLLLSARNLLRDHESVRARAARSIALLMVDEFQDTDPIQTEIVEALCGEDLLNGKLFLVGDVKQSIYRFRRAEPQVFRDLRERLPPSGRLPLTTNFRSQPAILNFVNALFEGALGDEYEPLVPPAETRQASPQPCIEFLFSRPPIAGGDGNTADSAQHDDSAQEESAADRRRREGEWIAWRLKSLLTDGVRRVREAGQSPADPVLRTVQPRDIVILFRAMTDVRYYEEALRRAGLEYYVVGGQAFYAQQEVFDLVNLCRCLDDPDDEIALLGVLRSPFFSLSDDALFALVARGREADDVGQQAQPGDCDEASGRAGVGSLDELPNISSRLPLFTALQQPPPPWLSEAQRERILFAATVLSDLRAQKDRLAMASLLLQAVDRTGYDAALLTEFLGTRKLANLNKLIDMTRQFDQTGLFTLADFVDQLQDAVGEEVKESLAATHPESSNVIRLMSIHQAKGLEFPVVVVADMDRPGNDQRPAARFDSELGPLVGLPDKFGQKRDNLGLRLHLLRERDEAHAETLRLLYVATTRAADHLILSANLKGSGRATHPWMKLLAERFDLTMGQPRTAPTDEGVSVLARFTGQIPEILVHHALPDLAAPASVEHGSVPLKDLREAVLTADPVVLPETLAIVPVDVAARRRFSVSEIEAVDAARRGVEAVPAETISRAQNDSPAEEWSGDEAIQLGTLVHAVLERVDFNQPEDWKQDLNRLAEAAGLAEDAKIRQIAGECVTALLDSDFRQHLAGANALYREVEFLLAWPGERAGAQASGIREQGAKNREKRSDGSSEKAGAAGQRRQLSLPLDIEERVAGPGSDAAVAPRILDAPAAPDHPTRNANPKLIAGTIDCLCQSTDGQWTIVDYKTSRISTGKTDAAFLEEYGIQLALYALAAREWLGAWPARVELVLLRARARRIAFDPAGADWGALEARIDAAIRQIAARGASWRPGRG